MNYFFYILQSVKDGSFYRGQTDDVELRLKKHNAGEVRSTKAAKPWQLVYSEEYATRKEAMKREREVKLWKKRERIVALIKGNVIR